LCRRFLKTDPFVLFLPRAATEKNCRTFTLVSVSLLPPRKKLGTIPSSSQTEVTQKIKCYVLLPFFCFFFRPDAQKIINRAFLGIEDFPSVFLPPFFQGDLHLAPRLLSPLIPLLQKGSCHHGEGRVARFDPSSFVLFFFFSPPPHGWGKIRGPAIRHLL